MFETKPGTSQDIETLERHRVFGGEVSFVRHQGAAVAGAMTFSIFVPDGEGPFPVLYWLSGLTCTANNFTEKAGAFRRASHCRARYIAARSRRAR
jgi:S-formylglutathione hydrolase